MRIQSQNKELNRVRREVARKSFQSTGQKQYEARHELSVFTDPFLGHHLWPQRCCCPFGGGSECRVWRDPRGRHPSRVADHRGNRARSAPFRPVSDHATAAQSLLEAGRTNRDYGVRHLFDLALGRGRVAAGTTGAVPTVFVDSTRCHHNVYRRLRLCFRVLHYPRNGPIRVERADMILGIGSDLANIERISGTLARFGDRFKNRVFTDTEQAKAEHRADVAGTYAKRWAAKEACSKALGTGLRMGISWKDMAVTNLPTGQPVMTVTGWAAERLKSMTPDGYQPIIHVTLTDDHPWAQAFVVIEARAGALDSTALAAQEAQDIDQEENPNE